MQEIFILIIGILVLILAFPIGSYLSKITKEELKQGQKWFKLIIFVSLIGTIISLILKNDILFFSFLFIIIVTSRSLKRR
tara:strand:+ start:2828 stop:3067 length:240 start_codon:yes stop_codon:yes gene_type:complete